jgi:small-conductance mechanosensitive channel
MLAADGGIHTSAWVNAGASIVVALIIATLVDRIFRARAVREAAERTGMSRETSTRLRFVRRLLYALILLIGVAVALSGFSGINNLARSLLASGVIAAAVVGFAARQVLANFVAGIMLAVTQPLRVGDWVTFDDNYGQVEDVRLNYTIMRTATEQRIVIPNERLAAGVLRNDTLVVDAVAIDVSVWLAPEADVERALAALSEETGSDVSVAEATHEGVRLSIGADPVPAADRGARESALRRQCLARLRREGLLRAN